MYVNVCRLCMWFGSCTPSLIRLVIKKTRPKCYYSHTHTLETKRSVFRFVLQLIKFGARAWFVEKSFIPNIDYRLKRGTVV